MTLKQPARGLVATTLIMAVSLVFVSLFDFSTFTGWVAYGLLCGIPMLLVMAVTWKGKVPAFAARRAQPAKGLLLASLLPPAAVVVGIAYFRLVGGGVGPPTPMLMMCTIVSVAVTFWASIMWGGWPFMALANNPVVGGLGMLTCCYVVNYLLFRVFYSFEFMQDAPGYVSALDPRGLFNAWHAMVYYVTALSVMFLMLNFDLWPLSITPRVMRQPLLGVVWTIATLAIGAGVYCIGVTAAGTDPVVFMVRGPVSFIFGTIIVLNMLQGSLFQGFLQPLKGVLNAGTALVIGTGLCTVYAALAPALTGHLSSGPPAYYLEIWLASALLSVTFPFLAIYADLFAMWPFASDGGPFSTRPVRSSQ